MLKFDIITLFPNLIQPHLTELPFKRALEKDLLSVNLYNLRDYSTNKHNTVDDKPYGGGVGMILSVEPIYEALKDIYKTRDSTATSKPKLLIMSPKGTEYTQEKADELKNHNNIGILCGRYEGIDARVGELDKLLDIEIEYVSIGKYVLSGGELPALVIIESITRLLPGVLEKEEATKIESFSGDLEKVEFPQYTRPEDFKGLKVPKVLLSGHHKEIDEWRATH